MKNSTLYRKTVWFVAVCAILYTTVPIAPVAYTVVVRGATRANVNRNVNVNQNVNRATRTNVNRNVNVNQNVNVDRHVNVDVDDHHDYHPLATAAAVAAVGTVTAAVVGSIVPTKPPDAVPVAVNGVTYLQVGSTWYQPQYAGTQVSYVVVNPPK
jgi:hypothetical protein